MLCIEIKLSATVTAATTKTFETFDGFVDEAPWIVGCKQEWADFDVRVDDKMSAFFMERRLRFDDIGGARTDVGFIALVYSALPGHDRQQEHQMRRQICLDGIET